MLKFSKGVVILKKETKPFNDVVDHMNKIEGNVTNGEFKGLPKWLRYFGYFIGLFFSVAILLIVVLNLLN